MRISDWSSDVCSSDLTAQIDGNDAGGNGDGTDGPVTDAPDIAVDGPQDAEDSALKNHHQHGDKVDSRKINQHGTLGEVEPDNASARRAGQRFGAGYLPARPGCTILSSGVRSCFFPLPTACRSEEHPSELQSLMRISYTVFCL